MCMQVVNHEGSLASGHYTSYIANVKGDVVACMLTSSKVWCSKGKAFKRPLHVIHSECQRWCRGVYAD